MLLFNSLISLLLISSATAIPKNGPSSIEPAKKAPNCGSVNVILVGLPPYHPLVASQGWSGDFVAEKMTIDTANIPKAGYNYMRLLFGPEQDVPAILARKMKGIKWDVATVGYGVRGSNNTQVTALFETIIAEYRDNAKHAAFGFSHSPSSSLEAVQRQVLIDKNCTATPGVDLGSEVFCDVPSVCTKEFK